MTTTNRREIATFIGATALATTLTTIGALAVAYNTSHGTPDLFSWVLLATGIALAYMVIQDRRRIAREKMNSRPEKRATTTKGQAARIPTHTRKA